MTSKATNKQTSKSGVAFEIKLDEGIVAAGSKKPKHLMKRMGNVEDRPTTPDTIFSKQQDAEQRRQAKEKEKIKKVQAHVNHVEKVSADTKLKKELEKEKELKTDAVSNRKKCPDEKSPPSKSEPKKIAKPNDKSLNKPEDKKVVVKPNPPQPPAKGIKKTGK